MKALLLLSEGSTHGKGLRQRVQEIRRKLARWLWRRRGGLALALASLLVIVSAHAYYYNKLFHLERNVLEAWARVEAGQHRRNHIGRNLRQLLLIYARYEREQITEANRARSSSEAPRDTDDDVRGLLERLNVVAEEYPDLQLNKTVHRISIGVVNTESEIAAYIISYNEAVTTYRSTAKSVPAKFFCFVLGFHDHPPYKPQRPSELAFEELKL